MFKRAKKVAKRFKVSVYGDAKTGKTVFALSFPKPAVIDLEKGSSLYADEFDFLIHEAHSFQEFEKILDWVASQKDPGFETLVIDPATILWQDLVDSYAMEVQKLHQQGSRKSENLVQADWGAIKRRWNRAMFKLLSLNLHVIMVIREKEETEVSEDSAGNKEFLKTGNLVMDAEKNVKYIFDFIVHTEMEEFIKGTKASAKGKKKITDKQKEARYFLNIKGSRRKELPKYSRFEITGKNAYEKVFKPLEKMVNTGEEMEQEKMPVEKDKSLPKPVAPKKQTTKEMEDQVKEKFNLKDVPPEGAEKRDESYEDSKFASGEDPNGFISNAELRQFYGAVRQLKWPDGKQMTSTEGKNLVYRKFGIDSMKKLKRKDFSKIMDALGHVAAGRFQLKRDNDKKPYLAQAQTAGAK